ncbi:MAG: potassium channel family protein [Tropicimonas sp.]|uniref:potassium channel family protein n=1 Tax=Tropicimonas sp. TaxID=2067044 RepID=UPI003A89F494
MRNRIANLRWGTLLALMVAAFVLIPFAGASHILEIAGLALFELIVVGAIFMSVENARIRAAGGALTLIWFVLSLASVWDFQIDGVLASLSTLLVSGALLATFRILMRRGRGDLDTLLGAIFGYLLLGLTWALLYVHIDLWQPGAFALPEGSEVWSSMLYYSLVTLTTVGYGDITPLSPAARMAAGFEAVVGVLYIAVMVGSIVGNLRSAPPE